MLAPRSVLVTGASRGLGFEFVKQFLGLESPPNHVFAACRNPDTAQSLREIAESNKAVTVVKLDLEDPVTIEGCRKTVEAILGGEGLNLLINNAGVGCLDSLNDITADRMMTSYKVNTIGPVLVVKNFVPLLKTAARATDGEMSCSRAAIINISSGVASITENDTGRGYAYRCSKVALNMATKNMSIELRDSGILVSALHPGWVQTDMGGPRAPVPVGEGVAKLLTTMASLTGPESTGTFLQNSGKTIPW